MATRQKAYKAYKGLPMEGFIARWYAKNTRVDSRGFKTTARAVAAQVPPGGSILEVAPGPGYLAIEMVRLGDYRVSGLDISQSFVRIAGENAREAGVKIDFRQGDAAHMPFPDASFDFVVCTAAFKNFTDPIGAINEIYRVLKPGGKASIFDLRKDTSKDAIDQEVNSMKLSRLNTFFTKMTFRFVLLKNAYTNDALRRMVSKSRFGKGEIVHEGIGFELRLAR
ncbi:MAG: class I SAM-dependent methyltransferase [Chloroflexota bacterium]